MSRLVILMRHGPAETRDPIRWPDDHLRPLTRQGHKQTASAAKALGKLKLRSTLVVSSPAKRARSTAEIVRKELGIDPALALWDELAPDRGPEPVLQRLARLAPRLGTPILVGHEPQLGELLGLSLLGEAISVTRFAKGGAGLLHFPGAVTPGAAQIEWLATRSQLIRMTR
ncbi:MAG: histidine phosphatase family protein [Thermoplasmata archaeon]|jgi:phosphohistidine phosphatase